MRHLTALLLALVITSCAALPAIIAAAIPIADRALDWIAQVERHVATVDDVDEALAEHVRTAIPVSRAAALSVRDCGMRAQGDGSTVDCAKALADLEKQLEQLFAAARPFGVQPVQQPGLLGAPPGGVGILGVPSACAIVRGAEACGASSAPVEGAAP